MDAPHVISAAGTEFTVYTKGHGVPLLLLHAFPLDHGMWQAQESLAHTLRLIIPDQRGFGNSSPDIPITSIEGMADDAIAILDALDIAEPALVCGVSMGGYVAQHIAARHPKRVRGLILCDTKLDADTPEARKARAGLSEKIGRRGTRLLISTMLETLLAQSRDAQLKPQRAEIESLLQHLIARQPVATVQASLLAMGARPDMTVPMQALDTPMLLVVGEEDTFTPPSLMEEMQKKLPDSTLVRIPQAGHLSPLEAPEIFNAEVMNFLRDTGSPDAAVLTDC
tara:strand:+ start:725 stop:1570 length:846 start_codon:yes stop_codon:yes gene_type:complete